MHWWYPLKPQNELRPQSTTKSEPCSTFAYTNAPENESNLSRFIPALPHFSFRVIAASNPYLPSANVASLRRCLREEARLNQSLPRRLLDLYQPSGAGHCRPQLKTPHRHSRRSCPRPETPRRRFGRLLQPRRYLARRRARPFAWRCPAHHRRPARRPPTRRRPSPGR